MARTNPDGHPGTGASAGQPHSGRAEGGWDTASEFKASEIPQGYFGERTRKGPTPAPPRLPAPTQQHETSGPRRKGKETFGLNESCQSSPEHNSPPPVKKVPMVQSSSLNGHGARPVLAGGEAGLRGRGRGAQAPTQPGSAARGEPRLQAPELVFLAGLTMYKHAAGTYGTRPLGTPAPVGVFAEY